MTKPEQLDFLGIMETEARAVASAFGVRPAHDLAAALVDRMQKLLGGSRVHIAKTRGAARRKQVHETMRREFTGNNYDELARRYGYTVLHTRAIVSPRKAAG